MQETIVVLFHKVNNIKRAYVLNQNETDDQMRLKNEHMMMSELMSLEVQIRFLQQKIRALETNNKGDK